MGGNMNQGETTYIMPLDLYDEGIRELEEDIAYLRDSLQDTREEYMTDRRVLTVCLGIATLAAQREYLLEEISRCPVVEEDGCLVLTRQQAETFAVLNDDVNFFRDTLSRVGISMEYH